MTQPNYYKIWKTSSALKKKDITITNAFVKNLGESKSKPNKICADKGSKYYNKSMKSWLKNNGIETHDEWNSIVAERFIITLKTKIYKYMTSIS